MIAVDTSVLSLALRRKRGSRREHPAARHLRKVLEVRGLVVLPGICVQEVLSGVRTTEQFQRLASLLAPFPVLLAARGHHVAAARIANSCRTAGVTVGPVDALIAALTIAHKARLLTTDQDFARIRLHSGLELEPYE